MTWFKVDDNLAFHPKVLAAGNAAMGLWVRAGSWSAQQLTDGVIPDMILPSLGTVRQAQQLVAAGLWTRGVGAWRFHEWNADGRQPTRASIESDRAAARERQRKHREERIQSHRDTGVSHGVSHADVTPLVTGTPTRPDPTSIEETSIETDGHVSKSRAKTAYPAEFELWWRSYPRREAKGDALKAWTQARKQKLLPPLNELVAATQAYAARVDDPSYLKLPGGWLRDRRWEDETAEESSELVVVEANPERDRWLSAHGVSLEEYLERKDEPGWLEGLKERARG